MKPYKYQIKFGNKQNSEQNENNDVMSRTAEQAYS